MQKLQQDYKLLSNTSLKTRISATKSSNKFLMTSQTKCSRLVAVQKISSPKRKVSLTKEQTAQVTVETNATKTKTFLAIIETEAELII